MDTLATNYAMALTAKDDIIDKKDKEIEDLKKLVEQLKKEKESEFRDKTELQLKLDSVINNSAQRDGTGFDTLSGQPIFNYAEELGEDNYEFTNIRRSRRKRRPKRLIEVTVLPTRAPATDPIPGQPRKRGRPRIKRDYDQLTDGGNDSLVTEETVVANDGQNNFFVKDENAVEGEEQIEVNGVLTDPSVIVRQKRKFAHSCDWPGCERSFRRPAFLRKHKRVHTGEKPFKCTFEGCGFASADVFCLRTHQMRHTGEKPFKCKVAGCGWSGRQQTSFDRHRRVIHGQQRTYHCDWPGCDRRYRDKHSLNYHRKSHTGEKDFMCSFPGCGKRFIGRSDMKKHESTHNAVKPFKCSWPGCGRSFVQKRYLALHNLKHTGERPFPCDWPGCEWRSFTPHEQAKHKKTHTGERPYPCERCERRFADESNLKAHLRTVHEGQKNHKCDYPGCGKKYTVRRTLLIHQMKAHQNSTVQQSEETVIADSPEATLEEAILIDANTAQTITIKSD